MVRAATRPNAGASASSASSSSANASASRAAESQGVPASFSAGQQFANNPLSALNRADYAGPHMASILNEAGGMFGNFGGMNPRDPNVMLGMLQNPEFLQHMRDMLSRPEVIDQIIASNPQMQAMGPQLREMSTYSVSYTVSSEYFRNMITNPEAMQRMARLSQMFGGGGLGDPAGLSAAPSGAWPPPGACGMPEGQNASGQNAGAAGAAPTPGANPLESLAQLQQLLGGAGAGQPSLSALAGLGAFPPAAAPPADSRPPEERYATQLEQLQSMGFYDARANLSALLMSGGSVEAAVGILLGQP